MGLKAVFFDLDDTLYTSFQAGDAYAYEKLEEWAISTFGDKGKGFADAFLSLIHIYVTVDGYSAEYQYDNTGRTLTVSLGEIAPNQTKAIRFDVTVNSDAYGMHIENTALVSGSNTPDKSGTDAVSYTHFDL